MKNTLIFVFILCLFTSPLAVFAQPATTTTTTVAKEPSGLSLFWDNLKERISLFFAWGSVDKVNLALDFADRKLKDYKRYRAVQRDKLAARSLKGYQKEINIVLDILEKESDPQRSEQIAKEVSGRVLESTAELELLYDQAPVPLKEKISQIISSSKTCYRVSVGLMSGEYREVAQSKWAQFKAKIREFIKKIYYKLWPI